MYTLGYTVNMPAGCSELKLGVGSDEQQESWPYVRQTTTPRYGSRFTNTAS